MDEKEKAVEEMSDEEFAEYVMNLSEEDEEDNPAPTEEESNSGAEEDNSTHTETEEEESNSGTEEEEDNSGEAAADGKGSGVYARLVSLARGKFPEDSEEEAVEKLLGGYEEERASSLGISGAEYAERREFEDWKRQRSADEERTKQADEIADGWRSDAEKLKTLVPDFDLGKAFENESFKSALLGGKSVFEAYAEANRARDTPKKRFASEIGYSESASVPGEGNADYMRLDDEQFMKKMRDIIENR